MNILLYSGYLYNSPGGIGTWTKKYIDYFNEKCEDKVILVNNAIIGKRAFNFEKYYFFSEIKRFLNIKRQFENAFANNIDIVHINSSCSAFGIIRDYSFIKKIIKKEIPYVVHFHCDIEFQINKWPSFIRYFAMKRIRKMVESAASIIVLNQKSFDYIKKSFALDCSIIPNFIDIEPGVEHKEVVNDIVDNVTFVGHAIKEKGIYEIVDAAKILKKITFNIVGESNDYFDEYCKEINNVNLIGTKPHEEIINILKHTDIFILPSYSEGFSMALLEAMSIGVPCIASNVGANFEMLENYGGIIIENITANAIADAIKRLHSRADRLTMGDWNIKKVYSSYSTASVIERFRNLYNSIVN